MGRRQRGVRRGHDRRRGRLAGDGVGERDDDHRVRPERARLPAAEVGGAAVGTAAEDVLLRDEHRRRAGRQRARHLRGAARPTDEEHDQLLHRQPGRVRPARHHVLHVGAPRRQRHRGVGARSVLLQVQQLLARCVPNTSRRRLLV